MILIYIIYIIYILCIYIYTWQIAMEKEEAERQLSAIRWDEASTQWEQRIASQMLAAFGPLGRSRDPYGAMMCSYDVASGNLT
jgi:hypothetical protein